MTIHLPEDLENSVRAAVLSGRYASEDAMVAQVLREYLRLRPPEPPTSDGRPAVTPIPAKSIWEEFAELRQSIPDEEWAKLPVDGAEQLDHYISGSTKRPKT